MANYKSLAGPSYPRCHRRVPRGCLRGTSGPRLRGIIKVPRECLRRLIDTPGTFFFGSSGLRAGDTAQGQSHGHPHFQGHSLAHSPGRFGPKGLRGLHNLHRTTPLCRILFPRFQGCRATLLKMGLSHLLRDREYFASKSASFSGALQRLRMRVAASLARVRATLDH